MNNPRALEAHFDKALRWSVKTYVGVPFFAIGVCSTSILWIVFLTFIGVFCLADAAFEFVFSDPPRLIESIFSSAYRVIRRHFALY